MKEKKIKLLPFEDLKKALKHYIAMIKLFFKKHFSIMAEVNDRDNDMIRKCESYYKLMEEDKLDIIDARGCMFDLARLRKGDYSEEVLTLCDSCIRKNYEYSKRKGFIDENINYDEFYRKGIFHFRLDKFERKCREDRDKKFQMWYDTLMGISPKENK